MKIDSEGNSNVTINSKPTIEDLKKYDNLNKMTNFLILKRILKHFM